MSPAVIYYTVIRLSLSFTYASLLLQFLDIDRCIAFSQERRQRGDYQRILRYDDDLMVSIGGDKREEDNGTDAHKKLTNMQDGRRGHMIRSSIAAA